MLFKDAAKGSENVKDAQGKKKSANKTDDQKAAERNQSKYSVSNYRAVASAANPTSSPTENLSRTVSDEKDASINFPDNKKPRDKV